MNFVSKQNCIWFFATWVTCYCKEHFLKNFWRNSFFWRRTYVTCIQKRSCLQSKAKENILILFTLCLNHSDYVGRPIVTKTNIHWGINLIFYNISVFLSQMSDVPQPFQKNSGTFKYFKLLQGNFKGKTILPSIKYFSRKPKRFLS